MRCLLLLIALTGCVYNEIPQKKDVCAETPVKLEVVSLANVSSCNDDGEVVVLAAGGTGPYTYSIGGVDFSESNKFSDLTAGNYNVFVVDAASCRDTLGVTIDSYVSGLLADVVVSADNLCQGSNGSVKVIASSGKEPYQFSFNESPFTPANEFNNLEPGSYRVVIKDDASCEHRVDVIVPRAPTGVSWSGEIQTIVATRCAKPGCHDDNAGRLALTSWANINANRVQVKNRVSSGSMPFDGPLPDDQKAKILCWIEDGAPAN